MSDGLHDVFTGNCWPLKPLRRKSEMKFDVETIKALEPGKIYALYVDFHSCDYNSLCEFIKYAQELGIKFLVLDKNNYEIKSVPEGYELVKRRKKYG